MIIERNKDCSNEQRSLPSFSMFNFVYARFFGLIDKDARSFYYRPIKKTKTIKGNL